MKLYIADSENRVWKIPDVTKITVDCDWEEVRRMEFKSHQLPDARIIRFVFRVEESCQTVIDEALRILGLGKSQI